MAKIRRTKTGRIMPSKKQVCGLASASKTTRKRVASKGGKAKAKKKKK